MTSFFRLRIPGEADDIEAPPHLRGNGVRVPGGDDHQRGRGVDGVPEEVVPEPGPAGRVQQVDQDVGVSLGVGGVAAERGPRGRVRRVRREVGRRRRGPPGRRPRRRGPGSPPWPLSARRRGRRARRTGRRGAGRGRAPGPGARRRRCGRGRPRWPRPTTSSPSPGDPRGRGRARGRGRPRTSTTRTDRGSAYARPSERNDSTVRRSRACGHADSMSRTRAFGASSPTWARASAAPRRPRSNAWGSNRLQGSEQASRRRSCSSERTAAWDLRAFRIEPDRTSTTTAGRPAVPSPAIKFSSRSPSGTRARRTPSAATPRASPRGAGASPEKGAYAVAGRRALPRSTSSAVGSSRTGARPDRVKSGSPQARRRPEVVTT